MKKLVFILALFVFLHNAVYGQISLAHSFGSGLRYEIRVVNLSISGEKIAVVRTASDTLADTVYYYNMDYSLWKSIPLPKLPGWVGFFTFGDGTLNIGISYSSELLFNTDTLLEVAVEYTMNCCLPSKILIVNENGLIVDSILSASFIFPPFEVHKLSTGSCIATVNTNVGAQVYNLPGTLPCSICGGALGLAKNEAKPSSILSAPIPNPSKNQVEITFTLPEGVTKGELTIYNTEGIKMKSYTVDNRFGFIIVDESQFPSGVYYYNISANGTLSSSQKMLVIK